MQKIKNNYSNYFKRQYKSTFTTSDINKSRKWLFSQWKQIERYIGSKKDLDILEIGSGIGSFYSLVSEKNVNLKYIGLELDKDAVKFANKYFNREIFFQRSIEDFVSKKNFSHVFAFEVLEHVDSPKIVIKKILNLLSDNGVFIGTSPYPFVKNIYADSTHNFVLHPKNWEKLFIDSGFRSVKVLPMSFFPYLWRIHKLLNPLIPIYIPFKYFISTTLIIAKK